MTHNNNDSITFVFTKKMRVMIKEIFEIMSIAGINIAGKTSKLDSIYIALEGFSQENIFPCKYISIISK